MIVLLQTWRKGNHRPSRQGQKVRHHFWKEKKIASADDDIIGFHRLSRKNLPSGFRGRRKKNINFWDYFASASASALLKKDRGNRYSSKVSQRDGLFSFSIDIIMYRACKIYIYLLNPTRNLWPDYSSVVAFYAVKPRFHSPPSPLVDTVLL